MFNWLKKLFTIEPYVNKGSSQEIYQMYLKGKALLSKDNVTTENIREAMFIMDDMTIVMHTNGDGDLVRELQALVRDLIGKD